MADDWLKGEPGKHINVYDLTLSQIESCNLHIRRYETADVSWAKFVYNNRKRKAKNTKFDIIIGPLADNSLNKSPSSTPTTRPSPRCLAARPTTVCSPARCT